MINEDNNTIDVNDVAEKVNIAAQVEKLVEEKMFSTIDELKETIMKKFNIDEDNIRIVYDGDKDNLIIAIRDYIDSIVTSITIEVKGK